MAESGHHFKEKKMTNLIDSGWWWAYLDDGGVIRVLPYTGDKIIQNTEQLPFCKGIFDPFKAKTKHEAQMMIANWLTEQQIEDAKKDSWTNQFSS